MKSELFIQFEEELEMENLNDLLKYIFDYFSCAELEGLLEHIKEEKQ